jgi:hypothetical protein
MVTVLHLWTSMYMVELNHSYELARSAVGCRSTLYHISKEKDEYKCLR